MNAMDRLAWTLLHFLWQGTLIAGIYAAARRAARSSTPSVRYLLACGAMAAMILVPIATWTSMVVTAQSPDAFGRPTGAAASTPSGAFALSIFEVPIARQPSFLPWVVAVWFAGAVGFGVRLTGGWIFALRLRKRFARPAPAQWQDALDGLQSRLRVSRPVRLLTSALVPAPMVVGFLRPVILLPVAALASMTPEQIEALFAHELAHIRRADYLVNLVQSIAEALLFYHPAVWWVSGHVRAEREMCCDDVAVSVCGDPLAYATALAGLESSRRVHANVAMAANGASLAHRIARLLGASSPPAHRVPGTAGLAAILLGIVTALLVFGQNAPRPRFEVASVKPSLEPGLTGVRPLAGRVTGTAPVRRFIQYAYGVQPFQIVGPAWIDADRYEIDAKADGHPTRSQLFLMLQSLLEDRFQLKFHYQKRELPVYTLVATKGGPKLPPPNEEACADARLDDPLDWAGGRMRPPGQGPLPTPLCGTANVVLSPYGARIQGGNVTMAELVRLLSLVLDRVVIDRTGYTKPFDVRLVFITDATTAAMPPPPPGAAIDLDQPNILAALQEQLGLKLESAKGPVDVLVIDHVERPTAN